MRKEDKLTIIEEIDNTLKEYSCVYLAETNGLDAEKTSALRRECFKSDIKLVAVKNTLLKKAMEKWPTITFPVIMGFVLGSLPQVFPGLPSGIAILWCLLSFLVGSIVIWATSGELKYIKKPIAK